MSVTTDGAAPAPRRSGRIGDGASFLLDTLRARPAARRILSGVSVLLAVFAVGLLAYPMYTNLYQGRLQSKLAIQFNKAQTKQAYVAGETAIGDPITKISIPAADLKPTVVDEIFLETPVGKYTYKVTKNTYPVEANDFSVISQTPGHTLTLTTCHPKGSARQRLVIKAELESPTANQPAPA